MAKKKKKSTNWEYDDFFRALYIGGLEGIRSSSVALKKSVSKFQEDDKKSGEEREHGWIEDYYKNYWDFCETVLKNGSDVPKKAFDKFEAELDRHDNEAEDDDDDDTEKAEDIEKSIAGKEARQKA